MIDVQKVAKKLAEYELLSFQNHSLARTYSQSSPGYYLYYEKFRRNIQNKDKLLLNIPAKISKISSYWFYLASHKHDSAEDLEDDLLQSQKLWKETEKLLSFYYLLLIKFREGFDVNSPMELLDTKADEDYDSFSRKFHTLNTENKNLALMLGQNEMLVWKYHHERKYSNFVDSKFFILKWLGLSDDLALEAAKKLAEASHQHDIAESTEFRISQKTQQIWNLAYDNLLEYYKIIISQTVPNAQKE